MSYFKINFPKTIAMLIMAITLVTFSLIPTTNANGNISITRAKPDPISKNNTWFIFEAQPGETVEDTVLIKNLSPNQTKVKISIIDSKTNKAGRFILKRPDEAQHTIGKWAELERDTIELAPNQAIPVKFSITIPGDIKPGEFSGGIVAEELISPTTGSTITTRIGNRIYLKIPGKTQYDLAWLNFTSKLSKFDLTKPFSKTHYFQFNIENHGNTVVRPIVTIDIYNLLDQKVDTIAKNIGEFQPGQSSAPLIKWEEAPLFGRYTAKATIDLTADKKDLPPDSQQKIYKEIKITIIPWEIIIIITLILIIIIMSALIMRAKKRIIESTNE